MVTSDSLFSANGWTTGGGGWISDDAGATWVQSYVSNVGIIQLQPDASLICGAADCALFSIPIPSLRTPTITNMQVDAAQLPFQLYVVGGFDNERPLPRLLVGVNGQAGLIYTMLDWSVPATAVSRPVPWQQNATLVATALVVNVRNYRHLACTVVSSSLHSVVWVSFDFGVTWRAAGMENLRRASGGIVDASMAGLVFVPFNVSATDASQSALLAGTQHGIYSSFSNDTGCNSGDGSACAWYRVDANLPSSVLSHLDYEPTSDVLTAGVLGRGVFVTPSRLLQPDALSISQQVSAQWTAIEAASQGGGGGSSPMDESPSNVSWKLLGALLGIAGALVLLLCLMRVVCKPGATQGNGSKTVSCAHCLAAVCSVDDLRAKSKQRQRLEP